MLFLNPNKSANCSSCPLSKYELEHPKIEVCGYGRKEALVICEAPGAEEDHEGKNLVGQVGEYVRGFFHKYDLDLDRDCWYTNAVDCRPPRNRKPLKKEMKCCWPRKLNFITENKPRVVFLMGDAAIDSFYSCDERRKFFSSMPLGYITRGNFDLEHIFDLDFQTFVRMLDKPAPNLSHTDKDIEILYEFDDVMDFLEEILEAEIPFAFDYETSSYRYYERIHDIYLVGISHRERNGVIPISKTRPDGKPWWSPLMKRQILKAWKRILTSTKIAKTAQNIKHEAQATWYVLGYEVENFVHDTMLATHVLDESKQVTGLKKQLYIQFGYPDYSTGLKSYMKAVPKQKNRFDELGLKEGGIYCGTDSKGTRRLARKQIRELKSRGQDRAYWLLHDGALAFSKIERNGIKLDVDLMLEWDEEWKDKIDELKDQLFRSKEAKLFERRKDRKLKYAKKLSDGDLRELLFDILGLEPIKETKTTYSVDEESLLSYVDKCELLEYELEIRKLNKLRGTYLAQFLRYETDGFLYPSFNLHLARSIRSSSSEPNFQNIPKRDERAKEIRKCLVAREGRELWTVDYSSMEVRILACQSHDPVLMDYIIHGGDMHADEAREVFLVDERGERFEKFRYEAKNGFVFPEFYGSYYGSIARNLDPPEDFPFKRRGSKEDQWEEHIKRCEQRFWRKYKKTREWQDSKIGEYKRMGYVSDGAWGFRRHGYLTRNKLYNFPIQGPAFHCLLWSIIKLAKERLSGWETLLCGQIHDELFFDGETKEFEKVKREVTKIMTEDIREENKWIVVPLEVEWSRGKNWLEMEAV